jgi:hypothetical protein
MLMLLVWVARLESQSNDTQAAALNQNQAAEATLAAEQLSRRRSPWAP